MKRSFNSIYNFSFKDREGVFCVKRRMVGT